MRFKKKLEKGYNKIHLWLIMEFQDYNFNKEFLNEFKIKDWLKKRDYYTPFNHFVIVKWNYQNYESEYKSKENIKKWLDLYFC